MTSAYDAARHMAEAKGIPANGHSPPFTEFGNGERLRDMHGADLLYCHDWKKWLTWDGSRFAEDRTGEIYRRATKTVRDMYEQGAAMAAAAAAAADERESIKLSEQSEAIQKWARRSEERRKIEAMIAMAQPLGDIPVLPRELDKNEWLLNCPNGTINLRTGALQDHDKADRITKVTSVEYDASAECPHWEQFLELVMGGDADLIGFMQRAAGYSLTGAVGDQVIFVLYGTGRNGKSTFLETLMAILGDYAAKAPPDLLMVKRGEVHPTEKTVLYGARFVPAIETEKGRRLNETAVKELTGGDTIQARRMHENFWGFRPTHHLWLATNHKPMITGTDLGIWRRIRLVPFAVTIGDDEEDTAFPDKLKAEWPGILAWAVRGCLEWQECGLVPPAAVQSATKEYRESMDVLGDYIAEHCIEKDGVSASAKQLYDCYTSWVKESGEKVMSKIQFGQTLLERGFKKFTEGHNKKTMWRGLALKIEDGHEPDEMQQPFAGIAGVAEPYSSLLDPRETSLRGDLPKTPLPTPAIPANGTNPQDPWEAAIVPVDELDL